MVYYCVGVYTGAVPRDLFRMITVDYPMALAQTIKKQAPKSAFVLLSGQGADRQEKSRMMFAKDKGEVENKLEALLGPLFLLVDQDTFILFKNGKSLILVMF